MHEDKFRSSTMSDLYTESLSAVEELPTLVHAHMEEKDGLNTTISQGVSFAPTPFWLLHIQVQVNETCTAVMAYPTLERSRCILTVSSLVLDLFSFYFFSIDDEN